MSRRAVYPPGSRTRSEVTVNTGPRNTTRNETTFAFDVFFFANVFFFAIHSNISPLHERRHWHLETGELALSAALLLAMLRTMPLKRQARSRTNPKLKPRARPKSKPTIAIVGPGKLGSALALALSAAGYSIAEVVFRPRGASQRRARLLARRVRAQAVSVSSARLASEIIWLCVPDRSIAAAARVLAKCGTSWKGKIAFHSSGALGSDQLHSLRELGASVASVHPFMTFVRGSPPKLSGVLFAVEGERPAVHIARRIVKKLGGEAFNIDPRNKNLYHAWGSFTSPLLVALLAQAEKVAQAAGVSPSSARSKMLLILRQTLENYSQHGAAVAFTGPMIRGDAATIRGHLQALARMPVARDVYSVLARSALQTLPVRNRAAISRTLKVPQKRKRKIGANAK